MNFYGLLIGIATFLIIGIFHPIVIKTEYYIGKKAWPVFLIAGIVFIALSALFENVIVSSIMGVLGFSSLWSIQEIIEQEERVRKGWFPNNPKKKEKSEALEKSI